MTDAKETAIRQEAQQDYREDRFKKPYPLGSDESLIYLSEQQRIRFKEFDHGPN